MKLTSRDSAFVELRVLQYQFPSRSTASLEGDWDWDANWLMVEGTVQLADGRSWTFQQPCLTTREAALLDRWMHGVIDGSTSVRNAADDSFEHLAWFTEPNVAVGLASRNDRDVALRVYLALESLPPWLSSENVGIYEYFVPIDVSAADFATAAEAWHAELAAFPER